MCAAHRVALVDDNDSSRHRLARIVEAHGPFHVVAEATTAGEAITTIQRLHPDLAILPVRPPAIDGFGILRAMPPRTWPLVIFHGAREDFALEAFELDAVDYVLEPVRTPRLQQALDRVALRLADADARQRLLIEHLLVEVHGRSHLRHVAVRHADRVEIVDLHDVAWIHSAANYVELHVDGHRHLHRSTLDEFAARLDPRHFVRIHRCVVANVDFIRELHHEAAGDATIVLRDGTTLRVARARRPALQSALRTGRHRDEADR